MAAPLTNLLKKNNACQWDKATNTTFENLKNALSTTPVLQLPNFDLEFTVCDASRMGIGVVLQQQGHSIAFFNRKLGDRRLKLLAYEHELIGFS